MRDANPEHHLSHGSYPKVTSKEARAAAVTARYRVSQGINPKMQIEEKKKAILETRGTNCY